MKGKFGVSMSIQVKLDGPTSKSLISTETPELIAFFPNKDISELRLYPIRKYNQKARYLVATNSWKMVYGGTKAADTADIMSFSPIPGKTGYYHITLKAPLENGEYVILPAIPSPQVNSVAGWSFAIRSDSSSTPARTQTLNNEKH